MKNDQVINNWLQNNIADSYNKKLSTDGCHLWSYDILIGLNSMSGDPPIIFDQTARTNCFISISTSAHVNLAYKLAKEKDKETNLVLPRFISIETERYDDIKRRNN